MFLFDSHRKLYHPNKTLTTIREAAPRDLIWIRKRFAGYSQDDTNKIKNSSRERPHLIIEGKGQTKLLCYALERTNSSSSTTSWGKLFGLTTKSHSKNLRAASKIAKRSRAIHKFITSRFPLPLILVAGSSLFVCSGMWDSLSGNLLQHVGGWFPFEIMHIMLLHFKSGVVCCVGSEIASSGHFPILTDYSALITDTVFWQLGLIQYTTTDSILFYFN